jgi:hypothetical protein
MDECLSILICFQFSCLRVSYFENLKQLCWNGPAFASADTNEEMKVFPSRVSFDSIV